MGGKFTKIPNCTVDRVGWEAGTSLPLPTSRELECLSQTTCRWWHPQMVVLQRTLSVFQVGENISFNWTQDRQLDVSMPSFIKSYWAILCWNNPQQACFLSVSLVSGFQVPTLFFLTLNFKHTCWTNDTNLRDLHFFFNVTDSRSVPLMSMALSIWQWRTRSFPTEFRPTTQPREPYVVSLVA